MSETDAAAPRKPALGYRPGVKGPSDLARDHITAELRAHGDLIYEFTKAWYRSPYTFLCTRVLGHLACKMPTDLWIFQDLFQQYKFRTVVETGTAEGGSALWFATLMDVLGIAGGEVRTVDMDAPPGRPVHPRIRYWQGSSVDAAVAAELVLGLEGPVLVDLDANHFAPHVTREMELYAPHVPVGSWLVVEDTNGAPVMTDAAGQPVEVEGSYAGMTEYLVRHPGEFAPDAVCERYWLTMNPRGWLQRVRPHAEP